MSDDLKSLVEMVKEAGRRPVSDRPDPVSDGLIARLTESQRKKALDYDGPEYLGPASGKITD